MGRPKKGTATWPPCVWPARVRATRLGTSGNTSGLWVRRRTGSSAGTAARMRGRVALPHAAGDALEPIPYALSAQPPVVVPEHGHGRSAEPGQPRRRGLRIDERSEDHALDDEVAQDDDDVRALRVRARHDL